MDLLVRTWNVFHGNACTPGRRGYLRQMIELASRDRPDVLCLQEVPLWALAHHLSDWSEGMHVATTTTLPSRLPRRFAGWMSRRHQGLWRSAIAGQANAILVAPAHTFEELDELRVSMPSQHPRRIHAACVAGRVVIVNAHISADVGELERTFAFAETWATVVLAGDLNLRAIKRPGWSAPARGIDHVVARGLNLSGLTVWDVERRTAAGVVLSDHAPVEATVTVDSASPLSAESEFLSSAAVAWNGRSVPSPS